MRNQPLSGKIPTSRRARTAFLFLLFRKVLPAMDLARIEQLQREFTDKYVTVLTGRPELARFQGITGRVKTVNMSGQALVEFDANNNIGWYDINLAFLKVIDTPLPPRVPQKEEGENAKAAPAKAPVPKPPVAKPAASLTADILAAARGGKPAAPAAGAKPSTADILAAARGKAAAPAAPAAAPAEGKKLSTADILAAARGKTAPAAAAPAAPVAKPAPPKPAPPPVEEVAAPEPEPEPAPAPAPVPKAATGGDKPKDTAGIIAYCRKVDSK